MARHPKMAPTEYGGSDVADTLGIQPAPHVLTAAEKLRLAYAQDPNNPGLDNIPVTLDPISSQLA